jgi:phosphatidylglycerophosphate synthase
LDTVEMDLPFDPEQPEHWRAIANCVDERFLWLPYDYISHKITLSNLLFTARCHEDAAVRLSGVPETGAGRRAFELPAVLFRRDLLDGSPQSYVTAPIEGQPGISLRPPATIKDAEAELVRGSGKVTDGIYTRFNRMLCRPAVRWLSHTPVTPNAVTLAGLAVSVAAGFCFAQGLWLWDVAGAAVFFVSGLLDEIDGMLARLKFRESALGCWLETVVDYSSYLLIFGGMTVGGYRRGGWVYLSIGAVLLLGSVIAFVVISTQRRVAAAGEAPNEYSRLYLATLDRDAGNPVFRTARQLQFLLKKGVLIHYLMLFALMGALPVLLFVATFGANAAWIVTIYLNRRLFSSKHRWRNEITPSAAAPVEVEK